MSPNATRITPQAPLSILFVCMGNICRSPLAEAVMTQRLAQAGLAEHVQVASAGTHFYHVGSPPDERSVAVGERHGYALRHQRAAQLSPQDARTHDYVVVMDKRNLRDARAIFANATEDDEAATASVELLLDYAREPLLEREVPDPYTGGPEGFKHVLTLAEAGCDGLLATLQETYRFDPVSA